jgi:lantibiotic leader peptide-processing serine protease
MKNLVRRRPRIIFDHPTTALHEKTPGEAMRSARVVLASFVLATFTACSGDAPTASIADPMFAVSAVADEAATHIFVFAEKEIPADFESRVSAAGGVIMKNFKGTGISAVGGLSPDAAAQLGASADVAHWNHDVVLTLDPPVGLPQVEALGEVGILSPSDPTTASFYPRQWHLRQIGAHEAWAAGRLGSRDVKVGILDTGIDYLHPDLIGLVDLSLSRSFVPSDDALVAANFPGAHPIADLRYHGTHVAATVASNAIAAAGVLSNVTLVGIKVLNVNGSGNSLNILSAIEYAADIGLDVINMSLGIAVPLSNAQYLWFSEMIDRTMEYAFRKGVVVIVSAGNENLDLDALGDYFKAFCTATTLTCVSATGPTARASVNGPWTDPDAKASYSNYGVEHISVAAPGGNGVSTVTAACSGFSLVLPVCRTGTFVLGINGTSMASPHATGVAALLVENVGRRQPGLVRQRLQQTAEDLGKRGADPIYGKGRISAKNAIVTRGR